MSDDAAAADALLQRILEARRQWVDVGDGAYLHLQRPDVTSLHGGTVADRLVDAVIGWRGVTLGHVLGGAASADERERSAPFSPALCEAVLRDNPAWLSAAADAFAAALQQHLQAREAAAGN